MTPESISFLGYKCTACNRLFVAKSSLQRHKDIYKEHHFTFPCCGDPFIWANDPTTHKCRKVIPVVSDDEHFTLPLDDEVPGSIADEQMSVLGVSTDMNTSNKVYFRCNSCPARFLRYQGIKNHILKNPGNHVFKCDKCGKNFLTKIKLSKHMCFLATGKFQCSCLLEFNSLQHFKMHIGAHRPYYCCKCNKKNASFNNLINHIRSHTKQSTFPCSICKKTFRVRESLTLHMKLHRNEKPFKCSKCDHRGTTKWNIQAHEKRHEPKLNKLTDRQHLCTFCGKSFLLKHHLVRHISSHTQDNLQLCRICGKLFSQKSYLKKHIENHKRDSEIGQKCLVCSEDLPTGELYLHHAKTGHFEYVCDPCCKVFINKFNLQRHQAKRHKLDKKIDE